MHHLEKWCTVWCTRVQIMHHFSKCCTVCITWKQVLAMPLLIRRLFLEAQEYKLLGVMINAALKWDGHVNAITSKAVMRLRILRKL